jgi:hypothetical protein
MKTLWCKNQENLSDRISHAWAPLSSPKADVSLGSRPSHSTQKLEHELVIGCLVSKGVLLLWVVRGRVLLLWVVRGRVEELPAQVRPGGGR